MAKINLALDLKTTAERILQLEIDDLAVRTGLGDGDDGSTPGSIQVICGIAELINAAPTSVIMAFEQQKIHDLNTQLVEALGSMRRLDSASATAVKGGGTAWADLHLQNLVKICRSLPPVNLFSLFPAVYSAASVSNAAAEQVKRAQAHVNEWHREMKAATETREELRDFFESQKQFRLSEQASEASKDFATLASGYETSANQSLGLLAVFALFAFLTVLGTSSPEVVDSESFTTAKAVHLALSRLLLLSFPSWLALLSARSYMANSHLGVLARQREKALKAFERFAAVETDPDKRSALIHAVATMVFSSHPTGYLASGSATGDHPTAQIVQTLGKLKP